MSLGNWVPTRWFSWVHGNNLVYNTCWEDPRLDRAALRLGPDDTVVAITSAGCNVLDYALDGPRHIHAVDVNPRQNALLELKMAGIRQLDFDTFFALFGHGRLDEFPAVYKSRLRPALSSEAAGYWDRHGHYFSSCGRRRRGLYFHGTTGFFAWWVNCYIDRVRGLRDLVGSILEAGNVEDQREIYFGELKRRFWGRFMAWAVGRDVTLALLGVPRAQREEVERSYGGGIAGFIEDCLDAVFGRLPLHDNYFWRVYLTGEYSRTCCPEYLKPECFARLKGGLVDRISVHTDTIHGFLAKYSGRASRFVLLDHMDWLCSMQRGTLENEWQAIVDRAAPSTRLIWRSGGMNAGYIDAIRVTSNGVPWRMGELLTYERELASELHARDRVHTYGSFSIADLVTA